MPIVSKLDELGRGAWLALAVLGFIAFWPLGLAIIIYMTWSGRMGCGNQNGNHWERKLSRMQDKMDWIRGRMSQNGSRTGFSDGPLPSSGNRAFDDYRAETLRRLEEEQRQFHDFLSRLRDAKDKSEFDQFMREQRPVSGTATPSGPAPTNPDA